MNVLIISANTLPSAPSGPAYIAGAALAAGHNVEVYETLFADDLASDLKRKITNFSPDVVGISIRLVHGFIIDDKAELGSKHLDLRISVKEIVECVRQNSNARIVLGGPGFNYYGANWLEYLNLDYGIRGEADLSFPEYLKCIEQGDDVHNIPGCIYRDGDRFVKVSREFVDNLDATSFPAYELFDLEKYYEYGISPALVTKRGCEFHCIYCPYSELEGKSYRVKSPKRVADEIEHICKVHQPKMVMFCDNNFNVPNNHAMEICQEIIDRKLDITWGTGTISPRGVSDEACRIYKASGCGYLSISVESASSKMLKQMQRGYTVKDVEQSLTSLGRSKIPFGVSLMFGAPGETPETISDTLELLDNFQIPEGVWVTIGVCLWTSHQKVLENARADSQLGYDEDLFNSTNYVSPSLPREYMVELVEYLQSKDNYTVQVNKLHADSTT